MTRSSTDLKRPIFVSLDKAAPRRNGTAAERFARLMNASEKDDEPSMAEKVMAAVKVAVARAEREGSESEYEQRPSQEGDRAAGATGDQARDGAGGRVAAQTDGPSRERPPAALLDLLQRLADMVDDPAMLAYGEWHATIEINRPPVTATTLDVTISPSGLSLRFSVRNPEAGEVLLAHGPLLSRSLQQLFDARGTPRSVSWQIV